MHNTKTAFSARLGAEFRENRVLYTVWCPPHRSCSVVVQAPEGTRTLEMSPREGGYFLAEDPQGRPGDRYAFTVDSDSNIPDFASRFQPNGVFESSLVVDPSTFPWKCTSWKRPKWGGQIVYEIHIGTFTRQGTYLSAIEKLDYLRDLGVNAVELMPLAEWVGERNWGYDGVLLMAPSCNYGTPDDLRTLVDECHIRGIAVILDQVFNHLGSIGNVSGRYSPYFFHQERNSPWGSNFDLDGPNSGPVRAFLLQVLEYWLDEYRMDGFRMDATHAIHDESTTHLMAEAAQLVHGKGGFMIAEDERNQGDILLPAAKGGWEFDAVWADDFHHSIHTGKLGHDEIYRDSYTGAPEELATILRGGWLYQGQSFPFTGKSRGTPYPGKPENAVFCLANHDQTGNRIGGEYLHHLIRTDRYRAASLLFLLIPYTPLLFMGQEWACNSPFYFFTDLPGELEQYVVLFLRLLVRDYVLLGATGKGLKRKRTANLRGLPVPEDYFTKKDFDALDKFYGHTWERLSSTAKTK